MRRIKQGIIFIIITIFIFGASIILSQRLNANQLGASQDLVTAYEIPGMDGSPFQIAVQSTSLPIIIWFTAPEDDLIGELIINSPSNFTVNSYSVGANSEPYDIVFDGTDEVWFTQAGSNEIGSINVNTKTLNEFSIPSGDTPRGIDISPNGTIWFVQNGNNIITSFDTGGSTFTDYAYTTANGALEEVEVLNNSTIWVSAPGANRISKFEPAGPTFSHVPLQLIPGSATFSPSGLTLDGSEPWASASSNGLIGRHAPGTLSFWIWFETAIQNFAPGRIDFQDAGSSNNIWFVDAVNGFAGRINTDNNGAFQGFNYMAFPEGSSANLSDIVIDSNDTVWIVKSGTNEIIQWIPPYFNFNYLPLIAK